MHRHRVGAENVDNEQIKLPLGSMLERKPRIAETNSAMPGNRPVCEPVGVSCDSLHGRIYFVERDSLARLRVGCYRADTQPQHADFGLGRASFHARGRGAVRLPGFVARFLEELLSTSKICPNGPVR